MNIPGFSEQALSAVSSMLEFSDIDWEKQFLSGKGGPSNKQNYKTDEWFDRSTRLNSDIDYRKGKQKGDQGKLKENIDSELLSPTSYPKGPGNSQGGSSKEVFGLRAFIEAGQVAAQPCPPKQPKLPEPPSPPSPPSPPQPIQASQPGPEVRQQEKMQKKPRCAKSGS